MSDRKGERLLVNLPASQARKRLKGYGFGVRKIQSAGRGQALIVHTATGQHRRQLEALFADVRQSATASRENSESGRNPDVAAPGSEDEAPGSDDEASGRAEATKATEATVTDPTGRKHGPGAPVEQLRNLGPISAAWLREIGVETRGDLERTGPVMAFQRVREHRPRCSLNLLWALAGALRDTDWRELPQPLREQLRRDAGW